MKSLAHLFGGASSHIGHPISVEVAHVLALSCLLLQVLESLLERLRVSAESLEQVAAEQTGQEAGWGAALVAVATKGSSERVASEAAAKTSPKAAPEWVEVRILLLLLLPVVIIVVVDVDGGWACGRGLKLVVVVVVVVQWSVVGRLVAPELELVVCVTLAGNSNHEQTD